MAIKSNAAKREAGKVSAKNKADVVTVNETDIWHGEFPKPGSGYMRDKAVLTAIAYPLIDMAKVEEHDGRMIVSFPKKIILPKTFTKSEVVHVIPALGQF